MSATRKKRAKPRAAAKAKKPAAPIAALKTLDAEWRTFISSTVKNKPLTEAWPDPTSAPAKRPAAAKKKATKKAPPKASKKAVKKKAAKK